MSEKHKNLELLFVPAERIRHIEELLGKMREFLKRRGNIENFCLTCGKEATDTCLERNHLVLVENYENLEVSDWAEAIDWVLVEIKRHSGTIDSVKLYGELKEIERKIEGLPNLYKLFRQIRTLPEVKRREEKRILKKFIRGRF
jgi:hypothetical protein